MGEEGVWVWHHRVNRDDCLIHCSQVLHKLTLPVRLLNGEGQGVARGSVFRNLVSSDWIPVRASGFKRYCLFQEPFPRP